MKSWGKLTSIDLKNCDLGLMTSKFAIQIYVDRLCELINMKKHGDTIIENFGEHKEVAGYSIVQLIETSSITGHFVNDTRNIYIDIFSCGDYDSDLAADCTSKYFEAKSCKINVLERA